MPTRPTVEAATATTGALPYLSYGDFMNTNHQSSRAPLRAVTDATEERTSAVFKLDQGASRCRSLPELQRQLGAGAADDAGDFWHHVGHCARCARAVVTLDPGVARGAPGAAPGPPSIVDPDRYQNRALFSRGPCYRLSRALDRERRPEPGVPARRSGAEREATDENSGEVVLKELPERAELPEPGRRRLLDACLRREAGLLARLRHPSIVRLLDAGEWRRSGDAFYACADVGGESLRDAVGRARRPHERLAMLRAFVGVADAIAYAHSHRVAHRNVNPGSIVYDRAQGRATLVDWSAAKPLYRPSPAEAVFDAAELPEGELYAVARGTPGFAAPEYASPERDLWADLASHGATPHPPERDLRADIFSLGATLHFIVTGRAPRAERGHEGFLGDPPFEGPGSPPDYPEGLRQIVAQATAHEPDERHDSALEFAWQLRRSLGL